MPVERFLAEMPLCTSAMTSVKLLQKLKKKNPKKYFLRSSFFFHLISITVADFQLLGQSIRAFRKHQI